MGAAIAGQATVISTGSAIKVSQFFSQVCNAMLDAPMKFVRSPPDVLISRESRQWQVLLLKYELSGNKDM
jgi:hypothetical protein